jgi:ABC-2 type transport system permease protein
VREGVIHDIGYQDYAGPRLGRGYAARSLYAMSLRTAFGLGRGAKAKIFPWLAIGIVAAFALVLVAVRAQSGTLPVSYVRFPGSASFLVLLFCAAVAPELVSRDLRSGVLPLYFSRPLTRADYAFAKLAAMVSAVWLLLAGPLLFVFVGGVFSVDGPGAVWDEVLDLLPGLLHAGIHALVFGSLSLLIASLAGRRAVAAAMIVGVFLVTTPIVGVVLSIGGGGAAQQLALLASPISALDGVGSWLFGMEGIDIGPFGPLYGAVLAGLVAACVLLLLARYRSVAR